VESILRLGKPAGELGPSTIVGSAAYNLMMISAVCTIALPTGERMQRCSRCTAIGCRFSSNQRMLLHRQGPVWLPLLHAVAYNVMMISAVCITALPTGELQQRCRRQWCLPCCLVMSVAACLAPVVC
jgi:hypothetical protein